jgi:hypothetical protein
MASRGRYSYVDSTSDRSISPIQSHRPEVVRFEPPKDENGNDLSFEVNLMALAKGGRQSEPKKAPKPLPVEKFQAICVETSRAYTESDGVHTVALTEDLKQPSSQAPLFRWM